MVRSRHIPPRARENHANPDAPNRHSPRHHRNGSPRWRPGRDRRAAPAEQHRLAADRQLRRAEATGSTVPLTVSKVRLTPVLWSQSFVAPDSTEPRAGVTLLKYTNPKPLTQAVLGKLSAGEVFGADVAQGYECTLTKENAIPGRLRATRVCWNDGLVIAALDHQDRHLGPRWVDHDAPRRRRDRDPGASGKRPATLARCEPPRAPSCSGTCDSAYRTAPQRIRFLVRTAVFIALIQAILSPLVMKMLHPNASAATGGGLISTLRRLRDSPRDTPN